SGTCELPPGAGKRWLKLGPAGQALGQWQASRTLTFQTGQPLTAILPTALSGTQSNGTDRPDLIVNPELPSDQRNPNHWFDAAALRPPPVFFDSRGPFSIPGSEGRNVITGPGLSDWDLSVQRHFRLNERTGLVFRSDLFNLTNHHNFD